MNIILFVAMHFFSAFGIINLAVDNSKKLKKKSALRVMTILLITLGLIGNYFLAKNLLSQ